MKLLGRVHDYFAYTDAQDEARAAAKRLRKEAKTKELTGSEKRQLRRAEELIAPIEKRRKVVAGAAGGVLLLGGAYTMYQLGVFEDSDDAPEAGQISGDIQRRIGNTIIPEAPAGFDAIAETDKLIGKVEAGFNNLRALVEPHIAQLPDEQFRDELLGPFEIVDINLRNTNRNGPQYMKQQRERGVGSFFLENVFFFFYEADPRLGRRFVAAFSVSDRTLGLTPDFNPDSLLDMLVLYHELRHATQDSNRRERINIEGNAEMMERYLAFHRTLPGERPRVVINEEATAYAYEIEILNLLMDGKLKADIENGKTPDAAEIQKMLNARPDQQSLIKFIAEDLASSYYPEGLVGTRMSGRFLKTVAKYLRTAGYEVLAHKPEGGLHPYEE